jgi:hypothetical protein
MWSSIRHSPLQLQGWGDEVRAEWVHHEVDLLDLLETVDKEMEESAQRYNETRLATPHSPVQLGLTSIGGEMLHHRILDRFVLDMGA